MIFDTHAHYNSEKFQENREALLADLPNQNVYAVVDCACDFTSAKHSLSIGANYPWFYTAVGIHPQSLIEETSSTITQFQGNWRAELKEIEALLSHPKVVAIGECGLDYYWPIPKEEQIAMFEAHLQLSNDSHMPIIIHDREAHADTYALLKEYRPNGVIHCYSGSAQDALQLVQQGMYFGIGGVVTFQNARKTVEAVSAIPLEHLLLETDCPYLAPVPFRGKQNHSGLISYIAEKIAEIKQIPVADVLAITKQNAQKLFRVS